MDNFTINRINTKKLIGVSINQNMNVETLIDKLSSSDIDFSDEISTLDDISNLKQNNFELFQNIQYLKQQFESADSSTLDGIILYIKENTKAVNIIDKFPHAGGSAILSNAGVELISIDSNLTTINTTYKNLLDEIENKTNKMMNASDFINEQTDMVKNQIFNKIISLSKQL